MSSPRSSEPPVCHFLEKNGTDFLISIAKSNNARSAVKSIATASKIPTIQADFSLWTYHRQDSSAKSSTSDDLTSAGSDSSATSMDSLDANYVEIVPAFIVLLNVLLDLPQYLTIAPTVTLLYDDFYSNKDETWKQMFNQISQVKFDMKIMEKEKSEIGAQINSLKNQSEIWLIGKTENIEDFFDKAQFEISFNLSRLLWRVFTKDVQPFKCEFCTTLNILWIRPFSGTVSHRLRHLKDFESGPLGMSNLITSSNEVEAAFLLDLIYIAWDFMSYLNSSLDTYPRYCCGCANPAVQQQTNSTLAVLMAKEPHGTYGNFIQVNHHSQKYFQDVIVKFTLIDFGKDSRIAKLMGNWTLRKGISLLYDHLARSVRNLNHYRVAIVIQPPFIEECHSEESHKSCPHYPYKGYCIDLIDKIRAEVNFDYELYLVRDGRYGTLGHDGGWNGIIRDIIDGEADIGLGPLSVTAERENFIDFTLPYYDLVGITILMRKQEVDYSLFRFMTVLELPVWICIVGAYFFTSLLLWIFDMFSPYSFSNNQEKYKHDPEKRQFTFGESLWFCITSLTPQGGGQAPKNISGRVVAATWWLFTFIIIASYTANLAAFLTVERLEAPISSLDDLAKQYKIKYTAVKGGATESYFRRMAEIEKQFYDIWKAMSLNDSLSSRERAQLAVWDYPVSDKFTNIWRFMKEIGLVASSEEAVRRVLQSPSTTEGFAFIGDATEIRYAELTDCRLQQVGNEFSRKPYAIAVQQESPLKDQISSAILKLLHNRELEDLKEKWWTQNINKVHCPKPESDSQGISIHNIGGVFIVIVVGIALSIATLAFEFAYYKNKGSKRKQSSSTKQSTDKESTIDTPVPNDKDTHKETKKKDKAKKDQRIKHWLSEAYENAE